MPEGSNVDSWWPSSQHAVGAPDTCIPQSYSQTVGATPSILSTSISKSLLDHLERQHKGTKWDMVLAAELDKGTV